MNDSKLIVYESRINFIPFRIFIGPLFHKPVTSQELFFAVSYSKPALIVLVAGLICNDFDFQSFYSIFFLVESNAFHFEQHDIPTASWSVKIRLF